MADAESAKKAIQDPNPVIDGRKANVNLAYLGAKPRGVQGKTTDNHKQLSHELYHTHVHCQCSSLYCSKTAPL